MKLILIQLLKLLIVLWIIVKFIDFITRKRINLYREIKNLIYLHKLPGPTRYPIFGNVLEAFSDEVANFNKLRKWSKDYSGVFVLMAYPFCLVNLNRPEDVEKIISTPKHSTRSFLYDFLEMIIGKGLVTSSGEKWQQHRKLLNQAFHVNVLQQFLVNFRQLSNTLVEDIENLVKNGDNIINVGPIIFLHGLKAVRETIMGNTLNKNSEEDKRYVEALMSYIDIVPYRMLRPWLYNNFFYYNFTKTGASEKEAVKIIRDYTVKVINNRINELKTKPFKTVDGKHMPVLDLLINAKNEGKIDFEEMEEEINTFLVGGFETTSNCLTFTLMLLANHESIQDELLEELNEICPDPNEEFSLQKLNELKLMERCLKESLRLYPPTPFMSRNLDEDLVTSNNHILPKGTVVGIHIYDVHRNPEDFPDPEKFDPDRFLPENIKKRHPYSFIAFGGGPRNCIGQKMSMMEMKIFISSILRKFKLEPIDNQKTLALYGQTFLRVRNGIRVKFVHRN